VVVDLYTDGSCYPNPGPGGWGSLLVTPQALLLLHGREPGTTTNNRMELQAIWEGLKVVKGRDGLVIHLYTDSEWCIGALFKKWNVSKNLDLIQPIREEMKRLTVRVSHVRGHRGDLFNEMAHNLASRGVYGVPKQARFHGRHLLAFTYRGGYADHGESLSHQGAHHLFVDDPPEIDFERG
jgi:ribonuclease HI